MFFYSLLATTLSIPIPQGSGALTAVDNPVTYLNAIYLYVVGISGVFALLIMVYSGVEYILSAGRPALQEAARHRITRTIFGLLLLFSAVLILNVIDPSLKEIKLLNVDPVKKVVDSSIIKPKPDLVPPYDERRCQSTRDDIARYEAQLQDKPNLTQEQQKLLNDKIAAIDREIAEIGRRLANGGLPGLNFSKGLLISQKSELEASLSGQPVNAPGIRQDLDRAKKYYAELQKRGFCK